MDSRPAILARSQRILDADFRMMTRALVVELVDALREAEGELGAIKERVAAREQARASEARENG